MENCTDCGHPYTPPVAVPQPIPDYMCAKCATQMTKEEFENLPWPYNPHAPKPEGA